jgi:hypothetical protein
MSMTFGVNLHRLREFFQVGRNAHGGVMCQDENVINAIERNLSLFSDTELLQLIAAADQFRELAEEAYRERYDHANIR